MTHIPKNLHPLPKYLPKNKTFVLPQNQHFPTKYVFPFNNSFPLTSSDNSRPFPNSMYFNLYLFQNFSLLTQNLVKIFLDPPKSPFSSKISRFLQKMSSPLKMF